MNDPDDLTLEGAQQDWAVVINTEADMRQREVCMNRLAAVDLATSMRIVTPMIMEALDHMDEALLVDVTALMRRRTLALMAVLAAQLRGNG